MKEKINEVKQRIEKDFSELDEQELEKFFDRFGKDERTKQFIEYYNKTVLNKEKIKFSEFNSPQAWATRCSAKFYSFFDKNYALIIKEIKTNKDITTFFKKYCFEQDTCIKNGKQVKKSPRTFCSKLFHTILPDEFPPVDNPIKEELGLQKEEFIKSVLIIKKGYELFIKENQDKILLIRKLLSKQKFAYLRINELSDIRILDMYYWFKLNREQ